MGDVPVCLKCFQTRPTDRRGRRGSAVSREPPGTRRVFYSVRGSVLYSRVWCVCVSLGRHFEFFFVSRIGYLEEPSLPPLLLLESVLKARFCRRGESSVATSCAAAAAAASSPAVCN